MVWSQYVYEATEGYDVIPSDEEDMNDELHLSIEDWQIKYSDELWALWDIIQQLLKDAYLEHTLLTECDFSDFAEFCYTEHDDDCDYVWIPYEFHLSYIWRRVQEYVDDLGMYNEIMSGATFDHWVRFVAQYSIQNNITVY
jgi:hypothetical protein